LSGVDFVDRCREVVVHQGPSDSSLAVYCQGYRRKKIRPVGNGVIGSEGTFLKLDW
jgi:hypothetical protein